MTSYRYLLGRMEKPARRLAAAAPLLILLLVWSHGFAIPQREGVPPQNTQQEDQPAPVLDFTGLSYEDINTQRLRLKLNLILTSTRDLVLQGLAFEKVTANDLPLFAEPVEAGLPLKKGEPVTLPNPVYVDIYFRELSSLDSLRNLLQTRQLLLRGTVLASIKVTGIQGLLTFGRTLHRSIPFEKSVSIDLLDYPLVRTVADRLLQELNDPQSKLGIGWVEDKLQLQSLLGRGEELAAGLVLIETRFRLQNPGRTEVTEFQQMGTGSFVGPARIITARSVVEPWNYMPEVASLLRAHHELDCAGFDVAVRPVRKSGDTASLSDAPLRLSAKRVQFEDRAVAKPCRGGANRRAVAATPTEMPQALVALRLSEKSAAGKPLSPSAEQPVDAGLLGIVYVRVAEPIERSVPRTLWAMAKPASEGLVLDRRFPGFAVGAPVFDARGNVRAVFAGENRCLPIPSTLAPTRH